MKKTFVTGILAAALIVGGGTGIMVAAAKENPDNSAKVKQEQGMNQMMKSVNMGDMQQMMKSGNTEDMQQMMKSCNAEDMGKMMETGNMDDMQKMMENQNMSFEEMKKQMKEMHPDLTD
jgi:hypothetical protein